MKRFLILAALAAAAVGSSSCVVYRGYGGPWYDYGYWGSAPAVRGPIVYRNPYYYRAGHHRGW